MNGLSSIEKTLLLAIALGNEFRLKTHNAQEYYYRFLPNDLNRRNCIKMGNCIRNILAGEKL